MAAPDKIYIQPNAHDKWWDGNKPNDNFQEYIRKDVLLEWANKRLEEFRHIAEISNDVAADGEVDAFEELIGKLNEI